MGTTTNKTSQAERTPIKMALGLQNGLILFIRKDKRGLYLGVKEHYKERGTYTGELLKVCENEKSYIFYNLFDIITKADSPEHQKKLKACYYLLQQTDEKLEEITRHFERWEG
jgi:hypothetical protein